MGTGLRGHLLFARSFIRSVVNSLTFCLLNWIIKPKAHGCVVHVLRPTPTKSNYDDSICVALAKTGLQIGLHLPSLLIW